MSTVAASPLAVDQGHRQAAEDLLPLLYDELRRLAASDAPGATRTGASPRWSVIAESDVWRGFAPSHRNARHAKTA